jgi:hypothetical protein
MRFSINDFWQFLCPISNGVINDPVIAEDGVTYDRLSIQEWFRSCSQRGLPTTSPITRAIVGTEVKDVDLVETKKNTTRQ